MPPISQTPLQKRATEAIMNKVNAYLDMRYQQVKRVNPKVESIWDDLTWQQTAQLRNSIAGDKAFGPVRFHVAELLLSDDQRRIRELFSLKSQNSLLGEIVEEKEKDVHRTSGTLEIHDMRTLYHAIDPGLDKLIGLIQTYIWWDLEDAAELARFEKKVGIIRAFEENGITEEMADYYKELMGSERKPSAEDVILFECRMLARTLDQFRQRRGTEQSYQVIIRRELSQAENPDLLIDAIASQSGMLKGIRSGKTIDDQLQVQFAKAMNCEPAAVSAERAQHFLETTINTNKKRLKNALGGTGSGAPFNVKRAQLDEMERRFTETVKDRKVEESSPTPVAAQ